MGTRLAAVGIAMVLLAGCGDDSAGGLSDQELRDAFTTQFDGGPFDAEGVNCVIDYLFENTTRDELNLMADAARPEDLSKSQVDIVSDAVISCG